VLDLTDELSPGRPLQPKPESVTMTVQPTEKSLEIKRQQLGDVAAHQEHQDYVDQGPGHGKLYLSHPQFFNSSLEDKANLSAKDSADHAAQELTSNIPRLDDSKQYTDLRNQTQDLSDVDQKEQFTSLMQQQAAPVSNVQIGNAAPSKEPRSESNLSYGNGLAASQLVHDHSRAPIQASSGHKAQPADAYYVVNHYDSHFGANIPDSALQHQTYAGGSLHDLSQFQIPTPASAQRNASALGISRRKPQHSS